MKKIIITLSFIAYFLNLKSQSVQQILSPETFTVTWLGVDFVHGHYELNETDFKYFSDYILRINKNVAEDHHRYYFQIAYKKDFVYNTAFIDKMNSNIPDDISVERKKDFKQLDPQQIQKIVSNYDFPSNLQGIGLVYLYDYVTERGHNEAKIWMAYIDIQTRKVLFLQNTDCRLYGKTFEDAWSYPVISMIRDSKKYMIKWSTNPDRFNLMNR